MASYEKINYSLRPSKQIERKLIVEIIHKLSTADYFIQDYTYLGFGSIYYVDFLLFHKYLHIDKMICVESNCIPKRMSFNKPFDFVELMMKPVNEVIPSLERDKKYFVWLDYDYSIHPDIIGDIQSCLHVLAPGSIFLVTIACDTRSLITYLISPEELIQLTDEQKKEAVVSHLNSFLEVHLGKEIQVKDLAENKLPSIVATALQNFIKVQLDKKENSKFHQLINFRYNDGTQMLSLGGIIDKEEAIEKLQQSSVNNLPFVTSGIDPVQISAPPLTLRERNWLEENLYRLRSSLEQDELPELAFEMKKELVAYFLKYYRYYPNYYETIL